jgi:hypothetical protein
VTSEHVGDGATRLLSDYRFSRADLAELAIGLATKRKPDGGSC